MDQAHTSALAAKHAALDKRIQDEHQRPYPNDVLIHDLKKQKLKLKEAILLH